MNVTEVVLHLSLEGILRGWEATYSLLAFRMLFKGLRTLRPSFSEKPEVTFGPSESLRLSELQAFISCPQNMLQMFLYYLLLYM